MPLTSVIYSLTRATGGDEEWIAKAEQVAVRGEGGHGQAPVREAAVPEPRRGGRRMDRIIAQGSVASTAARPVPIAPGGARLFAHKAHASTGGQEPSAAAPARFQGNDSLLLDLRPPVHCSSCLGVKDGLHRTVRLDRCRRSGFIIRTDCRLARIGSTTPKHS
jgi:hypothetical protein